MKFEQSKDFGIASSSGQKAAVLAMTQELKACYQR